MPDLAGRDRTLREVIGPFEGRQYDPTALAVVADIERDLPEGREVIAWPLVDPTDRIRALIGKLECSLRELDLFAAE